MQPNSEKTKIFFKRLFQSITQVDWEKLQTEVENPKEDLKNHNSGVLLWAKEELFNANEDLGYYLFVKSLNELLVVSVNSPKPYNSPKTKDKNPIVTSPQVELWKYYSPIGPPQ